MFRIANIAITLLLIAGAALQARAGVQIVTEVNDLTGGSGPEQATLYLEGTQMRMDMGRGNGDNAMLFDSRQEEMVHVDHAQRRYMIITPAMMQEMSSGMDAMMSRMQDQLKDLPPAQRERIQQMMGDKFPGMSGDQEPELQVEKTGETATLEGYKCRKYTIRKGGELMNELWVAPLKDLGLDGDARKTFEAMVAFQQKMVDALSDSVLAQGTEGLMEIFADTEGFPVKVVRYENGAKAQETVLTSVETRSFDAGFFDVPANYQEQEMPNISGGGMPGGGMGM